MCADRAACTVPVEFRPPAAGPLYPLGVRRQAGRFTAHADDSATFERMLMYACA
jgi:hypothetical protein